MRVSGLFTPEGRRFYGYDSHTGLFCIFFIENLIYNDIKIYNTCERRYFREYSRYLLTYIFISERIALRLTIKRGITIRE